jgi:DegT/DnrJ/EryC1/StrS aminotransferase family
MSTVFSNTMFASQATQVRYFSLARHALLAGLKVAGVGPHSRVLMPSYICRDLLAAVNILRAQVVFYAVGLDLAPSESVEDWAVADVVLAVDYFGFAQDLKPFAEYCARTGAVLIEDNAHGLFSRDTSSMLLGLRADIGLFSMRKTFPIPHGAALVVNRPDLQKCLTEQASSVTIKAGLLQYKSSLRRLPVLGGYCSMLATQALRLYRRWRTGHEIPPPAIDAEWHIPLPENPYEGLLTDLQKQNEMQEVKRRRDLYQRFATELANWDLIPVFPQLHVHCAPYGFAFRSDDLVARQVKQYAERQGFDVFRWPDLPDDLESVPNDYRNIWILNFLW